MEIQEIEQLIKKVNSKTALFEQSNVINKYNVFLSDNINKVNKGEMNSDFFEPLNREYSLMKKLGRSLYSRQVELENKKGIAGMAGELQSKFQPIVKNLKEAISNFINESKARLEEEYLKISNKSQSQQPIRPQQPQRPQPIEAQNARPEQTQSQQPQQPQPVQPQRPQPVQPQQPQPVQPQKPEQTQSAQQDRNIDMNHEKAVMDRYRKKAKLMEELQEKNKYHGYGDKPKYEEIKKSFESNKELFNEDEIERISRCLDECLSNSNDVDFHNELDEALSGIKEEAQSRKAIESHNVGLGDVCYASDTEKAKSQWDMYTNYTQSEGKTEFVTNKNSGSKTSYSKYDKSTNCAQIVFEQPVKVGQASGIFFNKDGSKGYLGISDQKEVTAANVKLNNGIVDFSLPENEALLKHPEVVAQIVKLYPDSLKSVPVEIYATDPKLFATMYAAGVKEALNDPSVLGNMEKDEYINEKIKALKYKTAAIQQNKGFSNVKAAAQTVQKDFDSQMSQMGD